jgi:hypothetical protein
LILADPVGKHATVISIVINTPLHFNDIVCSIRGHHGVAPIIAGLVVVHANPSIVSTWSTAANLCCFHVRPRSDGFKNRAFRAGVNASLTMSG